MPQPPRSVIALAEEVRALSRTTRPRLAVESRLRDTDLDEHDRIRLVIELLHTADTGDPHPADLAVCAFVAMGLDDFTLPPEPPIDVRDRLLDLRSRLLDLTQSDHPSV